MIFERRDTGYPPRSNVRSVRSGLPDYVRPAKPFGRVVQAGERRPARRLLGRRRSGSAFFISNIVVFNTLPLRRRQAGINRPALFVPHLQPYAARTSSVAFTNSTGVNGLAMKLLAPSRVASIAFSMDAKPLTIRTGTPG